MENVRECVDKFSSIYVFTYGNMRNEKMKEVRELWKPSRFFFGKNKVIGIGLGRSKEEEAADDLHKVTINKRFPSFYNFFFLVIKMS